MNGSRQLARPSLLPLAIILLLGASLRLLWIKTPLLDGHRWRQVDTAAIARNLYEGGFQLFHPQVDWGGHPGYVEAEFPVLPAIAAVLYHLVGQEDYYGRLIAVAFSTATIAVTAALAARLLGAGAGLAAAFLVSASPSAVFFGRTFMPDSPMLFFWVSGVFAFVEYFRTGKSGWLTAGSAATALACLGKIPAVMMLAPIAGVAWHARGAAALRDRRLWLALGAPMLVVAAWYWHAYQLYLDTGLTFGVLAHPAKTYPIDIAPGPWKYAFSKWSTVALLTSSEFYVQMLGRLHHFHLLPWGLAGALVGAAVWPRADGRLIADLWLAALVAFVLVAGEANISHEYYQLPFVPLAALYFGAAAGSLFEGRWTLGSAAGLIRSAVLVVVGVAGFYYSGVIVSHFRPNNLDVRMLEAGTAVAQAVPGDALLVVVDDYGVTSPLLLYFAHRKGWSFDPEDLRPQVVDGLRRRGARYFVSTAWSRVEALSPDTVAYLRGLPRLPLDRAPSDTVVIDLDAQRIE